MRVPPEIDWNGVFFQPEDLPTALTIRGHFGRQIVPVAGATLVGRTINSGEFVSGRILDLSRVKRFDRIQRKRDCYEIAAGTPFRQLETKTFLGALAIASKGVGGPAIRNRATLGGNLASARNDGDGSVATLAFPSQIELTSLEGGIRRVLIDDFFGPEEGDTAIREDELLTKITIPKGWRSAWYEVGNRIGASHSIVCCAAALSREGCVRIALGGAAKTVCRAKKAEKIISTGGLTDAYIQKAMSAVRDEVTPATDWHASADYRREMCAVIVKRVLLALRHDRGKP